MFELVIVTILSVISIVSQLLFILNEENKNDTNALSASWVSLVALCLMFVLPMAKRVIGDLGDWLFIVDSVVSLSAQGIAFGIKRSSDVLFISLVATITASYVGHFMKKKKEKNYNVVRVVPDDEAIRNYMVINVVKVLLSLGPIIVYVSHDYKYPDNLNGWFWAAFISLTLYILFGTLAAFVSPSVLNSNNIEICGSDPINFMELNLGAKPFKIFLSAIILSSLSVVYGETLKAVDMISVLCYVGALVCDHINAKYFKKAYKKAVKTSRKRRRDYNKL
jgi:hypothetical protein